MRGEAELSAIGRWAYRRRCTLTGVLSNSRVLSELLAAGYLARASLPKQSLPRKLSDLALAARRVQSRHLRRRVHGSVKPFLSGEHAEAWRAHQIGWGHYYGEFGRLRDTRELTKTLVLKRPGPGNEKGVLYCPFEYNWMRLIAHYDARAILSEYILIGASSWSPTDYAALANFAGLSSDPFFVGISNLSDMEAYRVLSPVIEPVPIMASDLVDPGFYEPRPHAEREVDILMVANWSRFKRHWLLFKALKNMPRNLRVVLVGRNAPGRTERELRAEARYFGAKQDIEYHTDIPIQQVKEMQCDARISAVFSYREGSCLAVAESLFADCPVAIMRTAHIGAKAYINAQTGRLVERRGLARSLMEFLEQASDLRAREWAVQNISCHRTTERLNAMLREYSRKAGLNWTHDIVPFCRRYTPAYVYPEDAVRMSTVADELEERFGLQLKRAAYQPAM